MKFSIIIPTYLEENYIERCLRSVVNQDYDSNEYEIIVSDAMSADKTVEIAQKYTSKVISSTKRGIAHGRNNGAINARGDILLFLDADAMLASDFLTEFAKTFTDENVLAATGIGIPYDGRLLQRLIYNGTYILVRLFTLFGLYLFPGICVAYKKTAFVAANGFREDFGIVEDLDLSKRISQLGICRVNKKAHAFVSTRRLEKHLFTTLMFHIYSDIKYLLTGKASKYYPKVEEVNSWKDLWQIH